MQVISHQTVKLSRGRHFSPASGMCVMELASVLAGERFSDEPQTVCPVIGALLRSYNDLTDHAGRQGLIPYAAKVVGTRAGESVRRARAERCRAWGAERAAGAPWWQWRRRRMARHPVTLGGTGAVCGAWAVQVLPGRVRRWHDEVLALVDELVAMGEEAAGTRPSLARREPELV